MTNNQSIKGMSFLATLSADIEHVLKQVQTSDTASDRRNALRTIISAMEGAAWVYRMHILSMLEELDRSTPMLERAFSETSLYVSENGQIREQPRFVSTTAMIRLTTRVAQDLCPGLHVDFNEVGWQELQKAIKVRNRITHPKSLSDLSVTHEDVEQAHAGFDWLLTTLVSVMESTLHELSTYAIEAKKIVEGLRSGDPDTIALYERVRREPEN